MTRFFGATDLSQHFVECTALNTEMPFFSTNRTFNGNWFQNLKPSLYYLNRVILCLGWSFTVTIVFYVE